MATKPDDEQEPLELTEELEPEPPEEQPENPDDAGEEEPTVSFEGEEPEPESDNSTVRQMRQALREKDKRIKELEQSTAPKPVEIGEKPTLAGCDYDEERFEAELDGYKERKAAADRQNEGHAEETRKANEAWQQDVTAFQEKKGSLTFEDRDEAIDSVIASLPRNWQAPAILKAANDPALFFYALSKSPAKFAEVLKFDDPIKLAAAVARMEGAVKVTNRKAPNPDRPARGSAVMPAGGTDKELERLEKEADRTGNRTAVINYKRAQKEAAAKAK